MSKQSLRHLIDLVETPLDISYLYWFWFHPATDRLVDVEGTHSTAAAYDLGLYPEGQSPDDVAIEDIDVIRKAIRAGWVRGRYGWRGRNGAGGDSWDATYHSGFDATQPLDLSLHGSQRNVFLTAKRLSESGIKITTLYVDFDASNTEMEGHMLRGARLDYFMKAGRMPSRMVIEAPISDVTTLGWNPETNERGSFSDGRSFGQQDRRALDNPRYVDRIVRTFANTPHVFEVFFVNLIDSIDGDSPEENDDVDYHAGVTGAGVHNQFAGIPGKKGVIRVVLLSNLSPPQTKMMMTGWILAHKIGHALQDHMEGRSSTFPAFARKMSAVFRAVDRADGRKKSLNTYDYSPSFTNKLTMKSARDGRLNNPFEMFAEIVAQYLVTGKVTISGEPGLSAKITAAMGSMFRSLDGKVLVEH